MNRAIFVTLVVVSATVLAGCGALGGGSAPGAGPETTSSPSPETSTTVHTPESRVTVYGNLSVNATRTWERVESLLGGTYGAPDVTVLNRTRRASQTGQFAVHLGLDEGAATFQDGGVGGSYSHRTGRVQIVPRNGSPAQVARILAHEYVHAVQYRADGGNQTRFIDRVSTREGIWLQGAILEGSAVYVEDVYTRRFLGFSALDQRCAEYLEGTPHERYQAQPYCFGGRYFAAQLDSPSDLFSPTTALPNTTEQVLHPGTAEPPANLTVVDETSTDWSTPASFRRQGELYVRTVLGVELPEERAIEAAAGWGNDRLVRVTNATGDTEGFVWVLRWDTESDAGEFESAFERYLDARGNRTSDDWHVGDDRFRVATVDNRTVAVITGNETFVDAVRVTERNRNVTVLTGEN